MNPSPAEPVHPFLEVRHAAASAVIVQRVPADKAERFLELQAGIAQAARDFPGYQKVDIYPPAQSQHAEWVVVIHFDNQEALQHWLGSPVRAEWVAKFHEEIGESRLKQVPSGFNAWFTGLADEGPPNWKIALAVLLPLFPTVVVLSLFLPGPNDLGRTFAILISNICSVSLLQWGVTPLLNPVIAPWLSAHGKDGKRVTLVGLVLILVTLAVLTAVLKLIAG